MAENPLNQQDGIKEDPSDAPLGLCEKCGAPATVTFWYTPCPMWDKPELLTTCEGCRTHIISLPIMD